MYLDTAILVKLVIREPESLFYSDLVENQTSIWSSQLALTECWSALCRKEQEKAIDAPTRRRAWDIVESYVREGSLRLQPVTEPVLRRANAIIEQCQPRVRVRALDAIHLASCEMCGAYPLLTNDRVMRKAADVLKIPLGPVG